MGLTVEQINKQEFSTKMRGYNQNEVQQFMATVAQTVQELTEENHALKETVKADEGKLKYFSELKDSLNKSILVAQEAADKVKNNAKREADIMIREAQKQATDIVSEANEKANQVVERSTEETRKLTTETNDLKKQTRIFRQRLQVMLESQLEVVKSDEWDKLLADEDLDQYNEIQKILGKNLDNDSSESVESTAISSEADQDQAAMAQQPAVEQPAAGAEPATATPEAGQPVADAGETVVVFPDSDQGKN
ncbi:MAG: DivIVA domain-containing protein [Limosilactobacillus oris]|jgi:cell division initiation protein|uniref:DivIVA domain-containing protein n=1 Tax=Limosilactobacillus oris TaxID=1632 RepID=UPI001E14E582|nr:DivIVA domain-containing protein [Limosilactobacillus oris]MCH3911936.1 DivIVA domain-containing protein [Limosilactobacillus oris]MCH3939188.1 DivIVA domain-containing protein [Limosilactobacillus oris]MCI1980411.1 DivIVA domain-containing protein [Limosilactobacillus oris]MCI2042768.1 DivIVA domain-containing protein [Limosilactobacillus oris]HJF46877.1 DivIVA domain-containing protein [Limosilactobacillus oris]